MEMIRLILERTVLGMRRRQCIHVLAVCVGLLYLSGASVLSAGEPNIILLMGDDHGWEETGYNGHPHVKTPVLDEMAASGLRLDRFYAAHPSCSPTRGSVLTGRHPNRFGTFTPGRSIRPQEITIAQILRKAGYATGHFGKWHLGPVKAASPTNPGAMGFDEWFSHDNFFELDPHMSRNGGPPQRHNGEGSKVIIDDTMRFIGESAKNKKPFLAVVWFGSPHEPYSALEKDLALYDNLPGKYSKKTVSLTSNKTGLRVKRPLRDVLRERYAEITAMDRAIGDLRKFLDREGLRKNTLVWYCGDNGTPPSGVAESPLRGMKGQMSEGGIRVPGVIEWPARISKSRTTSVNSVTSDMLPTFCELVGQPLPARPLDGLSLVDLIDGKMKTRAEPIGFWNFASANRGTKPYIDPKLQEGTTPLVKLMGGIPTRNFRNNHHPSIIEQDYAGDRTILDNQYKLLIGRKGDVQLFDLDNDPAETKDLAKSEPVIAEKLQEQMRKWQTSVLNSLMEGDYVSN
jgi:arylsulfatase A-like enzyme